METNKELAIYKKALEMLSNAYSRYLEPFGNENKLAKDIKTQFLNDAKEAIRKGGYLTENQKIVLESKLTDLTFVTGHYYTHYV